jgi:PAT family beta-lactamase induction signal transducer AmpG
MQTPNASKPWSWVPSLYFAEAIPYVVVMTLATALYKARGISNDEMAFYTSMLYWPWVLKFLWSPVVDMVRTKRLWTVGTQLVLGICLALCGAIMHMPNWFMLSLVVLWIMAFASATHDIAADGFYMLGLREKHEQAAFVGVRATFYRLATIFAGGVMMNLAGTLVKSAHDPAYAWSVVFFSLAAVFFVLCGYHAAALPRPPEDHAVAHSDNKLREFADTFIAFFKKPDILLILGFILTFRLGESQLLKLAIPFLLDPTTKGGLGLSLEQVGIAYSTIGIIGLTLGGLLGGYLISRRGLKRCLWLMVFAVHVPDLVFVYLATALPQNFYLISASIAFEQFGYGFGFTAMVMYMIMISDGEHKTAHYAICTGLMALGMMVPGMYSGRIQEYLGYQHFFAYVCVMTIPAFLMAALVRIPPEFGKKADA